MNSRNTRVPKNGDRVTARGEQGKFVIYGVDVDLKTVELKLVGGDSKAKFHAVGRFNFHQQTISRRFLRGE